MVLYESSFTTSTIVRNLPVCHEVVIQTDADIGVAFWNPVAGAYDDPTVITAPGGILAIPQQKAELTTAATASVRILNFVG